MACESWRDKLDAYADGELPDVEARKLAQHLPQCGSCAADALQRVQLKRAVSIAGRAYQPTADFRRQVEQSLGKSSVQGKPWAWKLVIAPAALVLIISLSLLFLMNRENAKRSRAFGEIADLHVATLASATPVDVVSTDRHTVKPWFEGKIPFSFNLPELQGTNFSLVGGRLAYLAQSPGAQLIYRLRQHQLSVFIFQERETGDTNRDPQPVSALSFTFETWSKNGLRYYVVGDVPASDIQSLSQLFRNSS